MVNRRTEVLPGEGLSLRFGQLSAWIGPGASPALIAFVVGHARDLSMNPFPGPEIANRLEGVLRGADPEPATPFLVVGDAPVGLEALLHGPVQLWDAAQWVVLPPGTGWLRHTFVGDGPVVAGPAGSIPPQLIVDSPIDLATGVVPGAGLALLPVVGPDRSLAEVGAAGAASGGAGGAGAAGGGDSVGVGGLGSGGPVGVSGLGAGDPVGVGGLGAAVGDSGGFGPGSDFGGTPADAGAGIDAGAAAGIGQGAPPSARPSSMPGGGLSGAPSAATIVVPPPSGVGGGFGGPPAAPTGAPPAGPAGAPPAGPAGPPSAGPPGGSDGPTFGGNESTLGIAAERPSPGASVGWTPEAVSAGPTPEAEAPRPPGGLRDQGFAGDQFGPVAGQGFVSASLREPPSERRPALPLASASVEESAGGVEVPGIRCSRGHFNHPRALYCTACGIATTQQTHILVRGPRPSLGVLVLDDGSTYSLDTGYVIGASPEGDDAVVRGDERPLRLPSPEDQISPVHAEVRLVDWDVHIIDRGSSSGTFVLPPGAQQWQPVTPGSPAVLVPNSHLACGRRVFAFESHLRN